MPEPQTTLSPSPDLPIAPSRTRFRWVILFLVFLATTINYTDRMVMGILAPEIQGQYGITDKQYGNIQAAFALVYAVGQLFSGRWLDWIGTRVGYSLALAGWSVASILHAGAIAIGTGAVWAVSAVTGLSFSGPAVGFGICRALLGVSESPNFPAAVKTLAEWFPRRERALAMGFVNAGSNVGAIIAPLAVPWLAIHYGWQWAFIGTGAVGVLWLVLWVPIYRRPGEHPRVSASELAHIQSDPPEPQAPIPWLSLLARRQAWAFMFGKFMTDPIWWFFMTWVAKFLHDKYGVDLSHIGPPLVVIYLMADVGAIAGGWLSSTLIRLGWSLNAARKTAMLLCALGAVPVAYAGDVTNPWTAVVLIGLAVAAHQGFSSNLYTLVSDLFPRQASATVSGAGGTCGYLGASLFSSLTGIIVATWANVGYNIAFAIAASAYLVAFGVIHLLTPRLKPAELGIEKV